MSISAIKYPSINAKLKGMYAKRLKDDDLGTAVVTLNSKISDDVLKKAVEEKDYTVTGIE